MRTLRKVLLSGLILFTLSAASAFADTTFNNPTLNGEYLDYCLYFGTQCGKPAADAYCVMEGFGGSSGYAVRRNIGRTETIGDHQICVGAGCGGFQFISCI
jgi:hypothetical protein